jgi:hypothetical protein
MSPLLPIPLLLQNTAKPLTRSNSLRFFNDGELLLGSNDDTVLKLDQSEAHLLIPFSDDAVPDLLD